MPLVVFCGIPAAGKTSVAEALVKYLHENQQEEVVHITEASVNVNRIEGYKDSRAEKMTRSALKAAVEHAVNSKTIVILDSLNYIKGFRYELFCKAKAESTTYCVVYVDTPVQVALERNAISSPNRTEQFDSTILAEIAARFEVPIEKNRWDSPLFRLTPESITKEGLPLEAISNALQFGKAVKAGLATQAAPAAETSFLQELDLRTNAIVDAVIAFERDGSIADSLSVPNTSEKVQLDRIMSTSETRRHRRQFIKISQMRPIPVSRIGDFFVDYLNKQS